MRRKPENTIPPEILDAARRAGVKPPLWYAGRRGSKRPVVPEGEVERIIMAARARAGITEVPELGPLPPARPDPFPED